MDLTQTIIAKSDQLNADDLIAGPQTFTVTDVRMGDSEQPVCIVLAEWPANRPFKPSKTVLRILVHAWGKESDDWPKGARMTLFRDADVKWAGQAIGGIRVSHLSHIDGKLKVALQESKGKKVLYTVEPLPDEVAAVATDYAALVDGASTAEEMRELWDRAKAEGVLDDTLKDAMGARVDRLESIKADMDAAAEEQIPGQETLTS